MVNEHPKLGILTKAITRVFMPLIIMLYNYNEKDSYLLNKLSYDISLVSGGFAARYNVHRRSVIHYVFSQLPAFFNIINQTASLCSQVKLIVPGLITCLYSMCYHGCLKPYYFLSFSLLFFLHGTKTSGEKVLLPFFFSSK